MTIPWRPGATLAALGRRIRLRDLLQLRHPRLAVATAIPSAIGFTLPLAVGLASGHVAEGTTAASGALIVGFVNWGGPYRRRAITLLATTLATGIAALLGGLAGPVAAATIVLVGVWGFASGLLVALGPRVALVGTLSTWALLLAGDLNLHGAAVLHVAGLITAGAAVQTAIAIVAWPLRPFTAEHHAVANAYRALAGCAREPGLATLQSSAAALAVAAETVGEGPTRTVEHGVLQTMVEQGEWIRLELAALARSDAPGVGETLGVAAKALDTVAAGGDQAPSLADLERSVRGIGEPAVRQRAERLTAWIAAAGRRSHRDTSGSVARPHPLRALQAELTLHSSAFRHAARLSVALVVADLLYRGLSLRFGYWVPVTTLFVLKPDHGTTMTRGVGKAVGTMAGVIVAGAIVRLFSPSADVIVVLLALLAWAAYAIFSASYPLFSAVLPILVALLAEFSGGSPASELVDRIVDTAAGIAIAFGAITLWPTREAPRVLDSLNGYVTGVGRWLDAIVDAYADGADRQVLYVTQMAARRARMHARDAVQRALAEPRHRRPDGRPLRAVLVEMDEIIEYGLALAAAALDGARAPRKVAGACRDEVRNSLRAISFSLQDALWSMPEPGNHDPAVHGHDQVLTAVATEAADVLAALAQLERHDRPLGTDHDVVHRRANAEMSA
jgi:uncharacterized membrane protein YccC